MKNKLKIEIVPVDKGWILEKMALSIKKSADDHYYNLVNVEVVHTPSDNAGITFFLPESAYVKLKKSISVTYIAHIEEDSGARQLVYDVAKETDYIITSSKKYQNILQNKFGNKVFQIYLAADLKTFKPKLKIGVVGRTYHTGRKGEHLLAKAIADPSFEFIFTGNGWPYPSKYYTNEQLADFYNEIDYLLIPSLIEGGPVPLLEALASGCEVISPSDIGLVEDFPHIPFERCNSDSLYNTLKELYSKKLKLRESVKDLDWSDFGRKHVEVFFDIAKDRGLPLLEDRNLFRPIQNLSIALVTHGNEYKDKGGPTTRVNGLIKYFKAKGYDTVHLYNPDKGNIEKFDIIHVFNIWPFYSSMKTIRECKKMNKLVVFSPIVLDLFCYPLYKTGIEYIFEGPSDEIKQKYKQVEEIYKKYKEIPLLEGMIGQFETIRQCCNMADIVITLSEHERNILLKLGVEQNKIMKVLNGGDHYSISENNINIFKKKYNLEKYVLCVGRIEYRKNQATIAYALKDVDVDVIFLGNIGDRGYDLLIRKTGAKNVKIIPRIDDKDLLASAYAGAKALIMCSFTEGASIAAIEASKYGIPLVLTDVSSEKEYFGDAAVYFSPLDPESLRNLVITILNGEKRKYSSSDFKIKYSIETHARNTIDVYNYLLKKNVEQQNQKIFIDMSTTIHYLATGKHFTGVPKAEFRIAKELCSRNKYVYAVFYNDQLNMFLRVDWEDIFNFDGNNFFEKYHLTFSHEEMIGYKTLYEIEKESPKVIKVRDYMTSKELFIVFFKKYITGRSFLLKIIKKIKPTFDNEFINKYDFVQGLKEKTGAHLCGRYFLKIWLKNILSRKKVLTWFIKLFTKNFNPNKIVPEFDFLNLDVIILPPRSVTDIRYMFYIKNSAFEKFLPDNNSRFLTLGQSWLSNEALLNKICLIAQSSSISLETYVYDLTYFTLAHRTGWYDNDLRQQRLNKIATLSDIVYTESLSVLGEIEKYKQTKNFNFKVIATRLGSTEFGIFEKPLHVESHFKFIIYISSFNSRKNHDFIVNVWKYLYESQALFKDVKLLLIGELQESDYGSKGDELRRFNIEMIHNATDNEIAWYYKNCLFTIYPSLKEGWGIPVDESLCMGKVCIASNKVPMASETVSPGLISLDPDDFFAWYETIFAWASNNRMRFEAENQLKNYRSVSWEDVVNCFISEPLS